MIQEDRLIHKMTVQEVESLLNDLLTENQSVIYKRKKKKVCKSKMQQDYLTSALKACKKLNKELDRPTFDNDEQSL